MKTEQNRPDLRKKLYVNPGFQRQFIIFTALITVAYGASFFIANALFYHYFLSRGLEVGLDQTHIFFDLLIAQRGYMNLIGFMIAVCIMGLTWFLGLRLSHRVVGPLKKIQNSLEAWSDGKPAEEIQLRENDFFRELADAVNKCVRRSQK